MVEDCRVPCITSFGKGFFRIFACDEALGLAAPGFWLYFHCRLRVPASMRWARPRGL